MKTVPLLAVNVRRDAMTILPTQVHEAEIPVLRVIHGDTNVYPSEEVVGTVELDPATEGARLAAKYGEDKVVAAYTQLYERRIAEAVSSIEAPAKAQKAKPVPA